MARHPFLAKRRKPFPTEHLEHALQMPEQERREAVAVGGFTENVAQIHPRLIDPLGILAADITIHSHPEDHLCRTSRLALHIGQQPGELAPVPQHIVRPFESHPVDAIFLERLQHRQAGRKRGGEGKYGGGEGGPPPPPAPPPAAPPTVPRRDRPCRSGSWRAR